MDAENHKGERIAKVMARAGLCSRRDAERWIAEGRVKVNGKTLETPACVVKPGDEVVVDGKKLQGAEKTRLFLYHKPAGLVTTARDEQGRKTVFDSLPKELPRVVSVGRLDLNTEGLLLLTNDGGLARYLELPATGWKRKYRVRVRGDVDGSRLAELKKGITVEGVNYKSILAVADKKEKPGANSWLTITLTEGKNREIRRVMEALGLRVNRLIRVSFGPFNLDKLPEGGIVEVKEKVMKEQIKGYFSPSSSPAARQRRAGKGIH
ncbi:MAG: rRNA pseudouridine synthase [Alphaproteobacteria bacterium]|nr:rRNA pseudouridine synthase [Alphaproteobacteria bacterium]